MGALLHNYFLNLCCFLKNAKSVLKNRISDWLINMLDFLHSNGEHLMVQFRPGQLQPLFITIRTRQQIHPNHKEFNPQLAGYQI